MSERTSADPAAPGGPEQPPEATQGVEAAGTPRADVVPVHGAVTAPTVASSAGSRDGGHGVVARPGVDLAVPLYAHPSTHPELWHASARAARHIRFAVVNVHNGVGVDLDLAYPPMIDLLRTARVRLVGYVDTAYGNRPQPDVVAEIEAWVARYGLRGVFFDQVRGDFAGLQYYSECALAARAAGAQFVVVNPGTDCDPAYAEVANVTVTFEGTWHAYLEYRPPAWVSTRPPSRFCHLVYDVPDAAFADAPQAVQARHAVTAFFSSGSGGNPWDRLDAALVDAWARTSPGLVSTTAAAWGHRRFAVDQAASPPTASATADRAQRPAWMRLRPQGAATAAAEATYGPRHLPRHAAQLGAGLRAGPRHSSATYAVTALRSGGERVGTWPAGPRASPNGTLRAGTDLDPSTDTDPQPEK